MYSKIHTHITPALGEGLAGHSVSLCHEEIVNKPQRVDLEPRGGVARRYFSVKGDLGGRGMLLDDRNTGA